ncbi:MAG: U32 family peptidase [Eubacteriales bacterium]
MKKPELLAPAGDLEKLKVAFAYGADAVYAGGSAFGLRAYAGNLDLEELKVGVKYTHDLGKKIYVTVNIFAHEDDFDNLPEYIKYLEEVGVDAIIVSDPGIVKLAVEIAPLLPVHLSTQANSTNSNSINFWLEQGVQRVILARELTKEELKQIRPKVNGEIELFVHGAMCMSYSGRCLLSNYLTGRDANKGECTQPCRWGYGIVEQKRPGEVFPLEEDSRGTYIFNSHDLCLLPYLPALKEVNIESWKIEGRMKSPHYVASTVKVYREAIDTLWDKGEEEYRAKIPAWLEEMDKVSHRNYSAGFFFGKPGADAHNIESSDYIREYNFVGRVLEEERCKNTAECGFWIEQRNYFKKGDILEVLSPDQEPWSFQVEKMWDEDGVEVDVARHAMKEIKLDLPRKLEPFSIIRKPRKLEESGF